MPLIGQTFQPGQDEELRRRLRQNQLGSPSQDALRVLSMRLPDVLSGRPPAPADLLRPRVGGAALSPVSPALAAAGGAPPAPGGGSTPEFAQLMTLISEALAATPAKPRLDFIPPGTTAGPNPPRRPPFGGEDRPLASERADRGFPFA